MELETINAPQFVDFTSGEAFDINDGADFFFGILLFYFFFSFVLNLVLNY
jgi:hypothetical protein